MAQNLPNGTIVKFKDDAKVYLIDNGKLRHITKEIKDKSGRSIFESMVTLDPSYRQGLAVGSSISSDLPFDPKPKGWETNLPPVSPIQKISDEEKEAIEDIKNDPFYSPEIEAELKPLYPVTEFGPFESIYYDQADLDAGTIPEGKKLGDLTDIGLDIRESVAAEWEPYYNERYQDIITGLDYRQTRQEEDTARGLGELQADRSRELEQEGRDYQETLRQYKKSFGQKGLTFSGEAERTIGTESAMVGAKPGTLELDRAYNLGKYETNFQRASEAQRRGLSRTLQDINLSRTKAERTRKRGIATGIAGGLQEREQEALNRYNTNLRRHESTAQRPSGQYL